MLDEDRILGIAHGKVPTASTAATIVGKKALQNGSFTRRSIRGR
jgi:hypothetical protein